MKFSVIDKKTGQVPDLVGIALKESWAMNLIHCDMEGFAINEEGDLILMDECGNIVHCPGDRFEVIPEKLKIILVASLNEGTCPKCSKEIYKGNVRNFCPNCGVALEWEE